MEQSQRPTAPAALQVPKRTAFIIAGVVGVVMIMIAASTLFVQNQANQIQAINDYLTQCWVGTQSKENYVFIYQFYGTSTLTPSYTPLVAALTKNAQYTATPQDSSEVALVASATPAVTATQLIQGDAKRGEVVYNSVGNCAACHDAKVGLAGVGPSLLNISLISQARFPGISPEMYLKESIILPNTYIVPGFSPDVMPKNYATNLTNLQVNDVIAYLMTLR